MQIIARSIPLNDVVLVDRLKVVETKESRQKAFAAFVELWSHLKLSFEKLTIVADNFSRTGALEEHLGVRSIFPTGFNHLPKYFLGSFSSFESMGIHRKIDNFDRIPTTDEIWTLFDREK